jgi:hypothetical protein
MLFLEYNFTVYKKGGEPFTEHIVLRLRTVRRVEIRCHHLRYVDSIWQNTPVSNRVAHIEAHWTAVKPDWSRRLRGISPSGVESSVDFQSVVAGKTQYVFRH